MKCEHPGCPVEAEPPACLCTEHSRPVSVVLAERPAGPASMADQVAYLARQCELMDAAMRHAMLTDEFDLVELRNTVKVATGVTHIMAVLQRNDDVALGGDQAWIDAARLVREEGSL